VLQYSDITVILCTILALVMDYKRYNNYCYKY